MGLFEFFQSLFSPGGPRVPESGKVWLTQKARVEGIAAAVQQIWTAGEHGIVVAHFPNTFSGMQELFDGLSYEYRAFRQPLRSEDVLRLLTDDSDAKLLLILSRALPVFDESEHDADFPDELPPVAVLAVEHHPLLAEDNRVRRFAAGLPGHSRLEIHASLDDALMRPFAGEWIVTTLKNLGMKDDVAVESPLVAKRIAGAQKKIENRATGNEPADSAEDWFHKNCPGLL